MNLILFYLSFGIGTLAGSSFLYTLVIFSQSFPSFHGFSGIVFFCLFLPFPLIFLGTGYLLDRYSKKWILFSFQAIHVLAAFLIFYFADSFAGNPLYLLPVAFLNGIAMTTVLPGRMAILRDIAPHHRLVFHTIAGNLVLILFFGINPVIIGSLKESFNFSELFGLLGSMNILSMILLIFVRITEVTHKIEGIRFNFSEVKNFLLHDTVSRQVMYVAILTMLALGPIQVLLPLYVRDVLGLGEFSRGKVLAPLGIGLFFGGAISMVLHKRDNKGRILLSLLIFSSFVFIGFFPFQKAWITSLSLLLFGIAGGVLSSLLPAILQKRSEDRVRGRLLSLYMVCFQFTPAVSGLVSAFLGDAFGIIEAFSYLGGFFLFASILSFFVYSELREA